MAFIVSRAGEILASRSKSQVRWERFDDKMRLRDYRNHVHSFELYCISSVPLSDSIIAAGLYTISNFSIIKR